MMERYGHFLSDMSYYPVRDAKYYDKGMVDSSVDFDFCFFSHITCKESSISAKQENSLW